MFVAHDWFTHTSTVSATARHQINGLLAGYCANVRDYAQHSLGDHISVCVTGSLARGEPAVRTRARRFRLASSVDLVVVVSGDNEASRAGVEAFTTSVLEMDRDILTRVYVVRPGDLGEVSGRFGVDLRLRADVPLTGPVPEHIADPLIGTREAFAELVHHLASIYRGDFAPATDPWSAKTALEALRVLALRDGTRAQRYSDLLHDRGLDAVYDPRIVANLIAARERGTALPVSAEQIYETVVAAACKLFALPVDERGLLDALHTIRPGAHLLDGFQYAVLAATMILYGPRRLRGLAASALHVAISALDTDALAEARPFVTRLRRVSPVDFTRGGAHPDRFLYDHMRKIYREYRQCLNEHLLGSSPVADYLGPKQVSRA
ncbi:hypothetical protein HLB23_38300 [Nocardia uniformis]|uniref:Uncharacterized protein n=1 Tax=Nocardia uniformis TaxID=53432 RepID=A0A849CFM4_9NOCA|nr:hypothetical protein [Nocardia uniformis]NNH75640.1 hypothetical protein [Nocardia uniformis]